MRPEERISVRTIDMHPEDPGIAFHNIKFCNDNLNCVLEAEKISYKDGNRVAALTIN